MSDPIKTISVDFSAIKSLEAYSSPEDALIAGLIADYESDSKKQVAELIRQLQEKNLKIINETAHGLKSISATLGMVQIAEICQQLEDTSQFETTTAAKINSLSGLIEIALSSIKQYLSSKV